MKTFLSRFVLLTLCVAGVHRSATAQDHELPRATVFGLVRDATGRPWVGAEVHVFCRSIARAAAGEVDHLVVRSDAHGKFRVGILTGRAYSAWACCRVAGFRYRTTAIREAVLANTDLILDENRAGPFPMRRVRFDPAAEFGRFGAENFSFVFGEDNKIALPLIADGEQWRLPPSAAGSGRIRVADGSGAVLWHPVDLGSSPDPIVVRFAAEKRRYLLRVRDGFEGPPIPGATIYGQRSGTLVHRAKTDADGYAEVELRLAQGQVHRLGSIREILVHKPGRRLGGVRATSTLFAGKSIAEKRKAGEPDLLCDMGRGHDIRGRVLLRPGVPAAGLPIRITVDGYLYFDKNSAMGATHKLTIRTDQAGRFVLPGMSRDQHHLDATLEQRHLLGLPAAWRRGLAPGVVLGIAGRGDELPDLVLADCAPIEFRITAAKGGPAALTGVSLGSLAGQQLRLHTDRAGRCRVLFPAGQEAVLAVVGKSGVGLWHLVKVQRETALIPCPLRLSPGMSIRGRVVDGKGVGITGADVYLRLDAPEDAADPGSKVFAAAEPVANRVRLQPLVNLRIIDGLQYGMGLKTVSGRDGGFEIVAPAVPVTYSIDASIRNGPRLSLLRGAGQVDHDGSAADPVELVIAGFERD